MAQTGWTGDGDTTRCDAHVRTESRPSDSDQTRKSNEAAEAAGFQDNQAKAKKIKIQNDEKGKKLVDEAIASRDSNGTLKHKSPGRTKLDDFQKAVKMLLDMNVGGRKIVMPEAAIISTIKASHPDVSDEKISETITLLKSRNSLRELK